MDRLLIEVFAGIQTYFFYENTKNTRKIPQIAQSSRKLWKNKSSFKDLKSIKDE